MFVTVLQFSLGTLALYALFQTVKVLMPTYVLRNAAHGGIRAGAALQAPVPSAYKAPWHVSRPHAVMQVYVHELLLQPSFRHGAR